MAPLDATDEALLALSEEELLAALSGRLVPSTAWSPASSYTAFTQTPHRGTSPSNARFRLNLQSIRRHESPRMQQHQAATASVITGAAGETPTAAAGTASTITSLSAARTALPAHPNAKPPRWNPSGRVEPSDTAKRIPLSDGAFVARLGEQVLRTQPKTKPAQFKVYM